MVSGMILFLAIMLMVIVINVYLDILQVSPNENATDVVCRVLMYTCICLSSLLGIKRLMTPRREGSNRTSNVVDALGICFAPIGFFFLVLLAFKSSFGAVSISG